MSRDLQVLRVKRGEMGFLAERGSQGLEGCQVPVGLGGRPGRGAHLEPLDPGDPRDLQALVVHQDSQERGVYRVPLALQGLQLRPVLTSQNQTTVVERTLSSATLSMTHKGCLFQDLRVPPGLSVHQVPEVQWDLLAHQDRMVNLEPLERLALWGRRESVGREVL